MVQECKWDKFCDSDTAQNTAVSENLGIPRDDSNYHNTDIFKCKREQYDMLTAELEELHQKQKVIQSQRSFEDIMRYIQGKKLEE